MPFFDIGHTRALASTRRTRSGDSHWSLGRLPNGLPIDMPMSQLEMRSRSPRSTIEADE